MVRRGLILSFLLLCSLSLSPHPTPRNVFAQNCAIQRTVSVSSLTKEGLPVDNLRAEDLLLTVNKKEQEILKLQSRSNEPLSIAILIDTSASQEASLVGTKLAAREFVDRVLRTDVDRVAVLSFTSDATIEQDFTNDKAKLRSGIDRIRFVPPPGYQRGGLVIGRPSPLTLKLAGATAIWDSVWTTVDAFKGNARRAIVILSDGEDTNSQKKMREAIEHAATAGVSIFSIGVAGTYAFDHDSLSKLSEDTGGLAFFPKRVSELDNIFRQVTASLQSQYSLTYCAAAPASAHKALKLQMAVKNPSLQQSKLQLSYPRYIW